MLIVHATNVHQGGGRSLLAAMLEALPDRVNVTLSLDSRMPLSRGLSERVTVRRAKPSILARFKAEWWLAKHVAEDDVVLCFGNLPPLFRLRGHVVVFVQNRYLVDAIKLAHFPLKTRFRLMVERLWLASRLANGDEYIVQTPSMCHLLEAKMKSRMSMRVIPFMKDVAGYCRQVHHSGVEAGKDMDFLYVASGEPHKNHHRLLEAWCLLAEQNLFPSLTLTLDEADFPDLCRWIDKKCACCRLNVRRVGKKSHAEVLRLYSETDALIFPSDFESFGLPLIEARQAGLPILAPELDYVRDLIDPEQTFDPNSSRSIARAVKRFLGAEECPLPLRDAAAFLDSILERTN